MQVAEHELNIQNIDLIGLVATGIEHVSSDCRCSELFKFTFSKWVSEVNDGTHDQVPLRAGILVRRKKVHCN